MLLHSAPLGGTPEQLRSVVAGSALPISSHPKIVALKRVPRWAMRFGGIDSRRRGTPQFVLCAGDNFEVPRVDALSVSAQVVDLQSSRDRTGTQQVRDAVSVLLPTIVPELAVSPVVHARCPHMASRPSIEFPLQIETIAGRFIHAPNYSMGRWDSDRDQKDQTFNDLVHFEIMEG